MSWLIVGPTSIPIEMGDDSTQTVTYYDATGAVVSTRPYSDREIAVATTRAAAQQAIAAVKATRDGLVSMASEVPSKLSQIQSDLAAVQSGWQSLSAADQTAIMSRVIDGFASIIQAMQDHLVVSGIIPPT